jgi:hypothetical protein
MATKAKAGKVKLPKTGKAKPVQPKQTPAPRRAPGPNTDYYGRISNAPAPKYGQPGYVPMPDRPGWAGIPKGETNRGPQPGPWGEPGRAYPGGSATFDESGRRQGNPQPVAGFGQQDGWGNPTPVPYQGEPQYAGAAKQLNAWTAQTPAKTPKLTNVKQQYKAPKAPKW